MTRVLICRYHPACINMTTDQAKQLADNFTCDREQCSDASASADPDMVGTGAGKEVISIGVLK
ncbi:hypothetical protein CTI12_AA310260 [Artemisia annua]|uniref:Uncharacterized protein n=1 Tax=Artemisia annua TaxID=35608 RepID=A0A2U1N477_ARTAN|nr:hypothetical protein CTI12_AA310260 [Artemisia annua]